MDTYIHATSCDPQAADEEEEEMPALIPDDLEGATKVGQTGYINSGVTFQCSSYLLALHYCIRVVTTPVQDMLYNAIDASGERWEKAELAKSARGLDRRCRVNIIARSEWEQEAMQKLGDLFYSEDVWLSVDPTACTVRLRAKVSCIMCTIGCCIVEYGIDINSEAPISLFLTLLHPGGIRAAIDEMGCKKKWDRFTHSWHHYFTSGGRSLDDGDARADLMAIQILGWTDNGPIESKHVSIRRELNIYGTQAKPVNVLNLSTRHILRTCRRIRFANNANKKKRIGKQRRTGDRVASKTKKRGGGGGYRAFVSEKTRGMPGGCHQPQLELHVTWGKMGTKERAPYITAGQAGTLSHREGKHAFALPRREVDRCISRQRDLVVVGETRRAIMDNASLAVEGESAPEFEHASSAASPIEEWSCGLRRSITDARRTKQNDDIRTEVVDAALVQFEAASDNANDLPPQLQSAASDTRQSPMPENTSVHFRHHVGNWGDMIDQVEIAVSVKGPSKLGKTMMALLEKDLRHHNQLIWMANIPALKKDDAKKRSGPCHGKGGCYCHANGKYTIAFERKYNSIVSTRFPAKTQARKNLHKTKVFAMFSGEMPRPHPIGDGVPMILEPEQHWFMIGRQSFQPVYSYFQSYECDTRICDGIADVVPLRGTWYFQKQDRAFKPLCKQLCWTVRFFQIIENENLLGAMRAYDAHSSELRGWPDEDDRIACLWVGPDDMERISKIEARREAAAARREAKRIVGIDVMPEVVEPNGDGGGDISGESDGCDQPSDCAASDDSDARPADPLEDDHDDHTALDDDALFGFDLFGRWEDFSNEDKRNEVRMQFQLVFIYVLLDPQRPPDLLSRTAHFFRHFHVCVLGRLLGLCFIPSSPPTPPQTHPPPAALPPRPPPPGQFGADPAQDFTFEAVGSGKYRISSGRGRHLEAGGGAWGGPLGMGDLWGWGASWDGEALGSRTGAQGREGGACGLLPSLVYACIASIVRCVVVVFSVFVDPHNMACITVTLSSTQHGMHYSHTVIRSQHITHHTSHHITHHNGHNT